MNRIEGKNRKLEPHKAYVYTIFSIYLYVVLQHNSPCLLNSVAKREKYTTRREEKPHICRFSLFFICTWSENIVYVYRFVIVGGNEKKSVYKWSELYVILLPTFQMKRKKTGEW